jgi:hypothetical protein
MKLSNDSNTILIGTKNFADRYYRDKAGWLKVSARPKVPDHDRAGPESWPACGSQHKTEPDH